MTAGRPPVRSFAPESLAAWIADCTRVASVWEISDPNRVSSRAGSPKVIASTFGTSASRKSASTRSSTITRCTEMHTWPALT